MLKSLILCFAVVLIVAITVGTVSAVDYEYAEEALTIPSSTGDYDIFAIYTYPVGDNLEKYPGIIMLHGQGSDKHEAGGGYDLMAPALAKAGIASLRFDFIGTGESKVDYIDFSFTSGVRDATDARSFLLAQEKIDPDRIGIIGWSLGGTIALLAAGYHPNEYQSAVFWAGAPVLKLLFNEEAYETAQKDGYYLLKFDWREPLKQGKQYLDEIYSTDVIDVFSSSTCPVLAIAGDQDTTVDPKYAGEIADASSNELSKELIIKNADHTFNIFTGDMTAFNELTKASVDWFVETLK